MFKFNDFETLIEFHKKWQKQDYKLTKSLIEIVDKNKTNYESSFNTKYQKIRLFKSVYDKAIFDIFVKLKPSMYNLSTKQYENWDQVFGENYDDIPFDNKGCLFCAVEETGGLYRFPPKYYE